MKSLRERFGLPEVSQTTDKPVVMMNNIQVPMDIMFEILIRQQNQLFTEIGNLNSRLAVSEAMVVAVMEQLEHMHEDVVELQQVLQGASQHPVEKVDDQTEVKKTKKDPTKIIH